jgi:hypothetical protein
VIDDYVELLDMVELGFTKSALNSADGQPAYHPKLLLKIYIYGYLNKIRSFRKLIRAIKCGKLEDIKAEIAAYIANFGLDLFHFYKTVFFLNFRSRKCYC